MVKVTHWGTCACANFVMSLCSKFYNMQGAVRTQRLVSFRHRSRPSCKSKACYYGDSTWPNEVDDTALIILNINVNWCSGRSKLIQILYDGLRFFWGGKCPHAPIWCHHCIYKHPTACTHSPPHPPHQHSILDQNMNTYIIHPFIFCFACICCLSSWGHCTLRW